MTRLQTVFGWVGQNWTEVLETEVQNALAL